MAVAATMMGLALAGSSPAHVGGRTVQVRTASLVPDPDGYLYCKVVATSARPIGIVATIVAADGTDVTDFGTGFRASPDTTGNGDFYAEETAGSLADGARYCQVAVTGARRKDVEVSLTAFDRNGAAVALGR
jgi:hypothetical protein